MMSPKRFASNLLYRGMAGSHGGLSRFGRLAGRAAEHVLFHRRDLERSWYFDQPASPPAPGWDIPTEGKIVYDFGANRGSNIPYYLSRGFRVVAVEANPKLSQSISQYYENHPSVAVENVCVVSDETDVSVPFYIHKTNDVLSASQNDLDKDNNFERIDVRGLTPDQLFSRHGAPFFVKIDLEGLDGPIANAVLRSAQDLPYISAEAHSIEPFCHFVSAGYRHFKIVEAPFVGSRYYNLSERAGMAEFAFSYHDAGPFGEDIPGIWLNVDEAFSYLQRYGIGWKDIHARRADPTAP